MARITCGSIMSKLPKTFPVNNFTDCDIYILQKAVLWDKLSNTVGRLENSFDLNIHHAGLLFRIENG